ncbi:MAG: HNH endonuclease signature motif containing protein, partial [Candidatus Dormibacteria bacterium]
NVVYQGKRARTFSQAKRRGLVAIQEGCAWPNCDRPVEQCDGHHLDAYSKGGKSTSDRGALTCSYHHDRIHHEGWALVVVGRGKLRPVPPGHPDNPRTGLSPEEYIRRRAWAIVQRTAKRATKPRPPADSEGRSASQAVGETGPPGLS